MLATFCLCLTATAAVALELVGTNIAEDEISILKRYTYSDFVGEFKRTITPSSEEWPVREALFKANLQKVLMLRSIPSMKWVPGITNFMDYHDHEYNRLLGYKGRRARAGHATARKLSIYDRNLDNFQDEKPFGAKKQGNVEDLLPGELTPVTYLALTPNSSVSLVHDQGSCGSCWADAALTVLEGAVIKNEVLMQKIGPSIDSTQPFFSRDYVISCTENPTKCGGLGGCDGATAELAFKLAWQDGIPLDRGSQPSMAAATGQTPQCPQQAAQSPKIRIKSFTNLPQNDAHIQAALLMSNGPIAVAVDATNWNLYKAGIYSDTTLGGTGEFTVNHIVALVGYNMRHEPHPYYLIKNSWGNGFGEHGFILIEIKDNEYSHCGWDTDAHMGVACDGDSDKAWVCGTCGILFDVSFPSGAYLTQN